MPSLPARLALSVACLSSTALASPPPPWLAPLGIPFDPDHTLPAIAGAAADRQLVLLGESTHGTHEFYALRDLISRQLIETGRFLFIAVEGDFAPLLPLNAFIKDLPGAPASAVEALASLDRWPTWMWANEETAALANWLREHNLKLPHGRRVGFYGMDVYAPWSAADSLLEHISDTHPDLADPAARKLAPLLRFRDDLEGYVRAHHLSHATIRSGLDRLLASLDAATPAAATSPARRFAASQHALVTRAAHDHFIGMAQPGPASWNARARHMKETVARLLDHYGPDAAGIVWAHNTHIGDARATPMATSGEVNIGQLARQRWGEEKVFSLGITTHRGTVKAGRTWGGERHKMTIPHAAKGSLEAILDDLFPQGALLQFAEAPPQASSQPIPHRAIGVLYDPAAEAGNYVPSRLATRYDALLFLPETQALTPLTP
jgi:erythromycin esterase